MNFRPGRKRMRTDIFGPWVPAAELPLQDSDCMPAVLQKAKHILEFDFTPEPCDNPDGPQAVQIPFAIFDRVLENHGIDIRPDIQCDKARKFVQDTSAHGFCVTA